MKSRERWEFELIGLPALEVRQAGAVVGPGRWWRDLVAASHARASTRPMRLLARPYEPPGDSVPRSSEPIEQRSASLAPAKHSPQSPPASRGSTTPCRRAQRQGSLLISRKHWPALSRPERRAALRKTAAAGSQAVRAKERLFACVCHTCPRSIRACRTPGWRSASGHTCYHCLRRRSNSSHALSRNGLLRP